MKYLRKTITFPLTLEADDLYLIHWWIDGAFATHRDMRSHTGGAMSLGKGIIYGTSTRQKFNTRSSTEAELVAVDDCMSQILWTRYFLNAQGYNINDCIVYQDNKSAILLEQNGRASSSRRTRHINIRYSFVTDHANCGEIKIKHCLTAEMVGDYFTKPLQGGLSTNSVTASLIYKLILRTYLPRITGVCWDGTTRTRLDSHMDSCMQQHKPIRPKGQKRHTRWWHEQEGSYIMNQMSMQSWCQWPNPLGDGT